ncbi:protein MIZU-KUSSEI 1-like [Salvia hispanica]|uniref:protein MIZU-KUSSEI 1-like n=1 Tax=Salvia hispanica TaxID=49212 RepID=UPI0020097C1C|nr:protein MIZU-KUSSEI 1-like [Salvia hispanica]
MKPIMAKTPQDSLSSSRRYFHWTNKASQDEDTEMEEILNFTHKSKSKPKSENPKIFPIHQSPPTATATAARANYRKRVSVKLRAALAFGRARTPFFVGTLFGQRRGHVRFAFQADFKAAPAFLVELATPTSALVKEMSSGLVRIALECEKRQQQEKKLLLEEPLWRTDCNGKKCGYAMRRDCGPDDWKLLNAVGPVSMGAGVLPGDGEVMYMRAKFERVVGSRDSEAFYMMNPDRNGGPELSIYLLRV